MSIGLDCCLIQFIVLCLRSLSILVLWNYSVDSQNLFDDKVL